MCESQVRGNYLHKHYNLPNLSWSSSYLAQICTHIHADTNVQCFKLYCGSPLLLSLWGYLMHEMHKLQLKVFKHISWSFLAGGVAQCIESSVFTIFWKSITTLFNASPHLSIHPSLGHTTYPYRVTWGLESIPSNIGWGPWTGHQSITGT